MPVRLVMASVVLALLLPQPRAVPGEKPRSVVRLSPAVPELQRTTDFDPAESAALFVGVQRFTRDKSLLGLRFAVDDAVDLAHLFALELQLVRPQRVVLLLSGEPQKASSRQRLAALLAAGARREEPTLSTIEVRLQVQARTAGARGLLVLGFASHGYSVGPSHHLMAADSVPDNPKSSLSVDDVFDWVEQSPATRRLVFLDACRERVDQARGRSAAGDSFTKSHQLAAAIGRSSGQVIFSAARPGQITWEKDGNGVFTAAVINGLHCQAEADRKSLITVGSLADYVNRTVTAWEARQHPSGWTSAGGIEVKLSGPAADLPLAFCPQCLPPELQPSFARTEGDVVEVYSETGPRLWLHKFAANLLRVEVADLNGDCKKEVVVGAGGQGADAGKVVAFDFQGKELWSADAPREFIYQGSHSGKMSVRALEIADLFGDGRQQTVVLYHDTLGWYPARLSIFDSDGALLSSYFHPGHLHMLKIGSRTPAEPPQIFVAGVNNDLLRFVPTDAGRYPAVVFALDPRQIRGRRAEAPPYLGSIGAGDHSWYGVLLARNVEIERLELLDRDADGIKELCVWSKGSRVLYLDFAGKLMQFAESARELSQFHRIEERSLKEFLRSSGGSEP
jgi:caspase domain-containing protein